MHKLYSTFFILALSVSIISSVAGQIERKSSDRVKISTRYLEKNRQLDRREINIPDKLRKVKEVPRFTASKAKLRDYSERMLISQEFEFNDVLDQYTVVLDDGVFPFWIQREKTKGKQLMTKDGIALQQIAEALVEKYNGDLYFVWENALSGFSASFSPEEAEKLSKDPLVLSVDPDYLMTTTSVGSWEGLDRLDQRNLPLDNSYTTSRNGSGVHVYIMDSGIDVNHPEFTGRIGEGVCGYQSDIIEVCPPGSDPDDCTLTYVQCDSTKDYGGHGTHVAGTVGGSTVGVANGVILHPVKVNVSLHDSYFSTTAYFCNGIDFISFNVSEYEWPAVVCASIRTGTSGASTGSAPAVAVQSLVTSGVTFVASSGNEFDPFVSYVPGSVPGVITVGATNGGTDHIWFENQGRGSNHGSQVDIFAPGVSIYSSHPNLGYVNLTGTSMATPHVAGAGAIYLEINPNATPSRVTQYLVEETVLKNKIHGLPTGTKNLLLHIPPVAPPTYLQVSAISQGQNFLYNRLTWIDNSNNETGFIIEAEHGYGESWQEIARLPAGSTYYNDYDAVLCDDNSYRVRAYNVDYESPDAFSLWNYYCN
ncbi:S8 family peptidase [Puniceicoccaceae bacterium K14]|nr:S8 family peptidase [Puniceicoccaceae bacterium K14]